MGKLSLLDKLKYVLFTIGFIKITIASSQITNSWVNSEPTKMLGTYVFNSISQIMLLGLVWILSIGLKAQEIYTEDLIKIKNDLRELSNSY